MLKVLEGGLNFIKKHRPYLLIEVSWGTNHPNWEECLLQYNKLFKMGTRNVCFKVQQRMFYLSLTELRYPDV